MNAKGHFVTGAVAGVAIITLLNRKYALEMGLGDIAFGLAAGGVAGLLPDWIEPATHPHHRALCHSIAIAGLMIWATWKLHSNHNLTVEQKKILSILCGGYLSHLAADGLTPLGLPFIGKEVFTTFVV